MDSKASTDSDRAALIAHITALEKALARSAATYGMTEDVRRLLARPRD